LKLCIGPGGAVKAAVKGSCAKRFAPVSVNEKGRAGGRGLTGAAGVRGPQGLPGTQGLQGTQGLRGLQGNPGPAGPITGALPRGVTLRGDFLVRGAPDEGQADDPISFGLTTSAAPTAFVFFAGSAPSQCPTDVAGVVTPAPGDLCLTVWRVINSGLPQIFQTSFGSPQAGSTDQWGFDVAATPTTASSAFEVWGNWAVTGS
jgi:hypothetical protein